MCFYIVCIHVLEYLFMHVLLIVSCSLKCHDMLGIRMHSNVSLALYTKWITWHCRHLCGSPFDGVASDRMIFYLKNQSGVRSPRSVALRHMVTKKKYVVSPFGSPWRQRSIFYVATRSPFDKWQPQMATSDVCP